MLQSLQEDSQSSDGARASPLTSLEEKQQIEADFREELNGKDYEIEQLKKVISDKELLLWQLEETIRRLNSEASKTRSVVSAAVMLTGTVEQLKSKLDEKDAEVHRLTKESRALSDNKEVNIFSHHKLLCTCCMIIYFEFLTAIQSRGSTVEG